MTCFRSNFKGENRNQLFVCKRSKATSNPCSASLSLVNGNFAKMNGKKISFLDKPLVNFHKHEDCQITSDQVESIKILNRMKERAKNQNMSVKLIYENETQFY